MSYYLQIIESYLKHKNIDILLEQVGAKEIQGSNPQERLNDIVKQVQAAQSKSENPLLLSFNGKTFKCWNNKDGKTMSVNTGQMTINITNNPQKIIGLLGDEKGEDEDSNAGEEEGAVGQGNLTPGQMKDMELGWKPEDIKKSLGLGKLQSYIMKLVGGGKPQIDLSKIPIFSAIKKLFPDRADEELIQILISDLGKVSGTSKNVETRVLDSFDNIFGSTGKSGSIANALVNHKLLVENIDGNLALVKRTNTQGAAKHLRKLRIEITKITDKIKRGEEVSKEECQKYQGMFVPMAVASKTKGRMFFPDPATGTGIVINDRDFKKKKAFDALLKSVGCSLGEDKAIGSLKGAAPDLRGKFMETLNILVQKSMSCVNYKGPVGECADKLGEIFDDYKTKKQSLVEALRAYDEVEDAAIPIGEEDQGSSLALATLRDYFGDMVPEKILHSTLKLAVQSFKIRRPDITQPISKDTKFGKRGDTLEAWETEQAFENAMQRQGVPEALYKKYKLNVGGFDAVDNSIKSYVTLKDDVSMGSLSKNTFKKIITDLCEDCKESEVKQIMEEVQKFRQGMSEFFEREWMANTKDSKFKELQAFYDRTKQISDSVDKLSSQVITKNSKGKEILQQPLKDYVDILKDQLAREYSYSDYQKSELIQMLDSFDESDDPRQIKGVIKSFVIGQEIKKTINSEATKTYLAMMAFGTGGSRNMITLLSANGVVDGESITCLQNSTLAPVKNFLDGVAGYRVEINGDGDKITFLGPKDVNNPEGESIPLYVIDSTISDTGNVTHAGSTTYENLKRSALVPKS